MRELILDRDHRIGADHATREHWERALGYQFALADGLATAIATMGPLLAEAILADADTPLFRWADGLRESLLQLKAESRERGFHQVHSEDALDLLKAARDQLRQIEGVQFVPYADAECVE